MRRPSNNVITLPFGSASPPYSSASPHQGTDFAYLPDNKIYAPFTGKVTQIPLNGKDGNGTYMTDSEGRYHGLLHASQYLVPNGSNVVEGQPVAVMGDTGFAQGIHLHWAVKQNGNFIDPMSIIGSGDTMDTKTKAKQLGDIFKNLTGTDIDQTSLDFYIQRPDGVVEMTYALFPNVQKYRDIIKLLSDDRDKNLYPYINKVTAALNLPNSASADQVVDAIKAVGGGKATILNKGDYKVV